MGLFDFLNGWGGAGWSSLPPDASASLDVDRVDEAERPPSDAVMSGVVSVEPRWRRGLDVVLGALPDVDDALAEEGEDVYLRMEADPDVAAALDQIDRRVLGRDLEWSPPVGMEADPLAVENAEYVARVIRGELDLRADLEHLFRAKSRRFAVSQVVWRRGDGRYGEPPGTWIPARLRPEDGGRFGLTRDGALFTRQAGRRVLLSAPGRYDRKFVYSAHGFEPRRPNGRSVLDRAYWPWKMLRTVEGYWLDAADRFAVPPIVALLEMVADAHDEKQVDRLKELVGLMAESLAPLQSGSTAAVAAKDVKAITANGGFDFDQFSDYLIRRIRKAILSSTLTVDTNGVGARAHAEEHQDEVDGVAMWYAADLARTVERSLGRWISLARYGDRARPAFARAAFDFRQPATFKQYLEAAQAGFPVSREAGYTVYNLPRPAGGQREGEPDPDAFTAERVIGTTATDPAEVGFSDAPTLCRGC